MTVCDENKRHVREVGVRLTAVAADLLCRALSHDRSKFTSPEQELWEAGGANKRSELTYGSPEHARALEGLAEARALHYKMNDHHPEFFADGVRGMSLVQLVEMLCDWHAAVKLHKDGDVRASIEFNQKRFGYSDELKRLLHNTVDHLERLLAVSQTVTPPACVRTADWRAMQAAQLRFRTAVATEIFGWSNIHDANGKGEYYGTPPTSDGKDDVAPLPSYEGSPDDDNDVLRHVRSTWDEGRRARFAANLQANWEFRGVGPADYEVGDYARAALATVRAPSGWPVKPD